MVNHWDDIATNYLRERAAEGHTRAQMTAGLRAKGYTFTERAVTAKAQRLGLLLQRHGVWCAAAIEILRRTAGLGSLAAQIELCEHGYHFERKPILRKASSLGLTVPRLKDAPSSSDADAVSPTAKQQLRLARIAASEVWANRPDDMPLPDSRPITLIDLHFHHCRWPLGRDADGARLFCGAGKITGSRYCPTHFNLSRKETIHGAQIKEVV